ncbi:MAG: ATP-binding protein [Steroidobacteraceae bacterium]
MPRATADSILFLDEIQGAPPAIAALRYCYEERGELAVIAAGSLMEFALAERRLAMPVGRVRYLHMGPMVFTEFLGALGETGLKEAILAYAPGADLGPVVHKRLLEVLRRYYFAGGMPAAVDVLARTGNLNEVTAVHNDLIATYRDDFQKYARSRDLARLQHVLELAARNVGTKVKYSNVMRDAHSSTVRQDIELLSMARVVSKVLHTHEGRSSNAKVDFVVAIEGRIVPIEVKAGARGSLRSLHQFAAEKHVPLAVRFDTNPPSRQTVAATVQTAAGAARVEYELVSLPLYLIERTADVVSAIGAGR